MNDFEWSFNLKMFVDAYASLGYETRFEDWNPRFNNTGEIRLDNSSTRSTTQFIIADSILTVEVRPWNVEIYGGKSQNIDLLQVRTGWRDYDLHPEPTPSPEGVAFLNHLSTMGFYPVTIPDEDLDIPCY
jgi:hypothetical protein